MPYTPPNRVQFRQMVSRDVRDPNNTAFSAPEVDDLVNFGLNEVSRLYPVVGIEAVDVVNEADGKARRVYVVASDTIHKVEVWQDGAISYTIPEGLWETDSGWTLHGRTLIVPSWCYLEDIAGQVINVFGYQPRATLHADGEVANVDADAEMGVRLYASLTAYQRLQNDRAQFQQWLAIPGNNDISATQLDSLANTYLSQWERHRNHLRTLRK